MRRETILCIRCRDETTHVPDAFPREWDGYCPQCAITLMFENKLPRLPVELFSTMIAAIFVFDPDCDFCKIKSPSQIITTPVGTVQYSNN